MAEDIPLVRWLDRDFHVYDARITAWNGVPGLYIFAREDSAQRVWCALYVGQTSSFEDRIPTHEKWPEARELGATHVHARVEEDAFLRTALERQLIQSFRPPLNAVTPGSSFGGPQP